MIAKSFINALKEKSGQVDIETKVMKFFKGNDGLTKGLGLKFGTVFNISKIYTDLPIKEINKLFKSPFYEVRTGAMSIMGYKVRTKNNT